jgi:benzylsuccinate CoA-transferase BbsF subunit
MIKRPFEGIKVLDFTMFGVGPFTTDYLSFYGAEVIKVESNVRPDGCRTITPYKDNKPGLERALYFAYSNPAKKYDITLNLNHPKGVELAKKLVAWADVVAESYVGQTMEKWGLGYDELKKIRPDVIMFRTCMHGQTGPMARQPGFGNQLTSLSGYNAIVGWPDRPPCGFQAHPFTDFLAPLFGIVSLIAALDYRRRTGQGQCLDLSQHEAGMHPLSPLILDYTVNGREPKTDGNRLPNAAPHGAYRCAGDDRWCVIAVFTDQEWQAFCKVIGEPAWIKDPIFETLANRKQNEDELDRRIEEWTSTRSPEEVMRLMQAGKVAAGVVSNARDQSEDPQLRHYHSFQELDHPEIGKMSFYHGPAFRMSKTNYVMNRPPLLGEDNDYVFTKILGIPDEEFVQLIDEKVIY